METLSNLERELIVSYLAGEHVMLNVFCANGAEEESLIKGQLRLETGKHGVSVSKDGVITLIESPELALWAKNACRVTVVFYFRKLGLSFDSALEKTSEGFCLSVPKEITRLKEKETEEKSVTASVYFSLSSKKDVRFACESTERFALFKAEVWQRMNGLDSRAVINTARALGKYFNVPLARISKPLYDFIAKTGRLLFKKNGEVPSMPPFDFDLCITQSDLSEAANIEDLVEEIKKLPYSVYMPLDGEHCLCAALAQADHETIENLLAAVSACAFASSRQAQADEHIQGRASPLSIVFLSDKLLVLGGKNGTFPLKTPQEYAVQISCAVPHGKRIIHAALASGAVISLEDAPESDAPCAVVCPFTSVEAEDRRFLFEKLYGTIFKQSGAWGNDD
jgi:hypothetical protein